MAHVLPKIKSKIASFFVVYPYRNYEYVYFFEKKNIMKRESKSIQDWDKEKDKQNQNKCEIYSQSGTLLK